MSWASVHPTLNVACILGLALAVPVVAVVALLWRGH